MRRLLAAGAAILLALVGAVLLLGYVHTADRRATARALAGVQTAPVVVATATITRNTSADKLASLVTVKELPRMAIANGAVADIKQLTGKVATVDIQPGEQLLANRFAAPDAVPDGDVKVPDGMEQVSLLLPLERVAGGLVTPGAHVGVWRATKSVADNVLVTHIQAFAGSSTGQRATSAGATQPAADSTQLGGKPADTKVMVTLAMTPPQIQAYLTGIESDQGNGQPPGEIWLSLDKPDAH